MSNKPEITALRKILFQKKLLEWHNEKNTRQMPWKGETDPYKIWLSEIILQQTRVQQGWQYYEQFIQAYPTITDLAKAEDDAVFKLWEGLGYYSRCRNLLTTARSIAFELNGRFPDTYEAILQLKGVGPYTAAAIASFAFALPHAVVDGNVYRVLSRWFGVELPIDLPAGKIFFSHLANDCLDSAQPAAYNQSIMDFGATICTPAAPQCGKCPLQPECVAYNEHLIHRLPVKTKTLQKTTRWFTYFIIRSQGGIVVRKRMEKGIWQDLHEFYLHESNEAMDWSTATATAWLQNQLGATVRVNNIAAPVRQQLTHQTLLITFIQAAVDSKLNLPNGYFLQKETAIHQLAFPKTLKEILQQRFSPTLPF